MKILGVKTLTMYARWVRSRFSERALIIGYHRIVEARRDPYAMCVSPQHFAEHIEVINRFANPLSLKDLVQNLEKGNLPNKAVVLTFDDGYADILYHVKPLLERHRTPATVFIVTGFMGRRFWWDELEHIIMSPKKLPEQLRISINGNRFHYTLDSAATTMIGTDGIRQRERFLRVIYKELLPLSSKERQRAITSLRNWEGSDPDESLDNRVMTSQELIEMVEGGLLEAGAHTATHPILSKLTEVEQRWEVEQSKTVLEEILERKVTSFAYPHGLPSKETITLIRDSGFVCACASFNDIVRLGSDPFNLPRFWIPDWDGRQFSRWLKRWINS